MPGNSDDERGRNRPEVGAYAVKLTPFWTDLPDVWFLQAESHFRTARITVERTMYEYVLQSLPMEVVKGVYQTVIDCSEPNAENPYSTLKSALTEKYTMNESQRLEKLLEGAEMADLKPSEYFNSLKLLAGRSKAVNEQLLSSIWLRKLPALVQVVVQSRGEMSLETKLASADSAYEIYQRQNSSCFELSRNPVSQESRDSDYDKRLKNLEKMIESIDRKFSNFKFSNERPRSRSRNRSKGRGSSKEVSGDALCFYHMRFGEKAHKCKQPCSYSKNSTN